MTQNKLKIILGIFLASLCATSASANNLTVADVAMGTRNPAAKTIQISFKISWENSWRNKINHDAVWVITRLTNNANPANGSSLCSLSASGLNPDGTGLATNSDLEIVVPTDKVGAFIQRKANGPVKNVDAQAVQLTIDYNSCGFSDSDTVSAQVIATEMVYIPQGSFSAGDLATSQASLKAGSSDSKPWTIASENAINVTNNAANSFHYVSAGQPGEYATGTTFTIPATFPKGYAPFYVMKYEISEGQWVEFVNSISYAARNNHDITDNNHKNSDSVLYRNTISCSGSPLVCTSDRPARAVTFLSWMNLAAYLDWLGLRPVTELEFEKIARGPIYPVSGEFAWGNTTLSQAVTISGTEDGSELITDFGANANYANVTLTGGDANLGVEYSQGPLRNGIFATSTSTRETAGSAYYGVMEMSGNVSERIVTIGNSSGLIFDGTHGDGQLNALSGYEGYANILTWPGIDADTTHGVTGANGSGFKGGSWIDSSDALRISDRSQAAFTSSAASNISGGRGARTYENN